MTRDEEKAMITERLLVDDRLPADVGQLARRLAELVQDDQRQAKWRRFDYDAKPQTAPHADELVWVVEDYYTDGVTVGYFDGFTFRLWNGSDDCHVSMWAPMAYPPKPGEPG